MEKVTVIVQARMDSTRLAGKVMKEIAGKTVLSHVIERLKQSDEADEIMIATTDKEVDEVIAREAVNNNIPYFRGSESDVLSRYYYAAKESGAAIVVRVTSDCPLIDPNLLDEMIVYFKHNGVNMVSNASSDAANRTYPRGLDVEVFSFVDLEKAYRNARETYQKEHVTPYLYENLDNIYFYKSDVDYSEYRWTLDTEEDWELICAIYDELYKGEHNFYLSDIIELMKRDPQLSKINEHVEQKKLK